MPDVTPFELRKLRLLNGTHSYLAYAGTLRGHVYVNATTCDPQLLALTRAIITEATETLPKVIQSTTPDYITALLERFRNPHLQHKLRQMGNAKRSVLWNNRTFEAQHPNGEVMPGLKTGALFLPLQVGRQITAAETVSGSG